MRFRFPCWLLFVSSLNSAKPDREVLNAMRSSASDVYYVQILRQVTVSADLNLVVAVGTPVDRPAATGDAAWWGGTTTLGILLQRKTRPDLVSKIAISKGRGDCMARVERATATDVVLSCTPEKPGPRPNQKFFYDLQSQTLTKRIESEPFSLTQIFNTRDSAVLIGSDTSRLVAVAYNPAATPSFEVLRGVQAQQWTRRVKTSEGTEGSGTALKKTIQLEPKQFESVRFGEGRFTLSQAVRKYRYSSEKWLVVIGRVGRSSKQYALPQTTYDEFARARPASVKNGNTRQVTTIDEDIGPWQLADGTLWFAKSFFDDEGSAGMGGFGYFDTQSLRYRIYSPPEVVDWSCTAMLVLPDAVWLALASNGEYGSVGGGILRFDRATGHVERFLLHAIVNKMTRIGSDILAATDVGAAVLTNHKIQRFFLDQNASGQLQMAEALPVQ